MTNTSKETPAVQNCGNVSTTATTPENPIILEESDRVDYLLSLGRLVNGDFQSFFESQPHALAVLGAKLQVSPDKGEKIALNRFINAIRDVNEFIIAILQRRGIYDSLWQLISSMPYNPETTTTEE